MGSKAAQSPALSPIDVLSAYAYCLLTKGAQLKTFQYAAAGSIRNFSICSLQLKMQTFSRTGTQK